MAIPSQYGGDATIWFNDVVGKFAGVSHRLNVMKQYFPYLTAAQKTSIKSSMVAEINTTQTELNEVITEINAM